MSRGKVGQTKYFHAFNLIGCLGPVSFKKLLNYFGSLEKAWEASEEELRQAGLEKSILEAIKEKREKINPDKEIIRLKNLGINILTLQDKNYPSLLKEISQPPALLYYQGNIKKDELTLAVVGPRKPSFYGQQVVRFLVEKLSLAGLTIVSGLARGIDTLAHQTALKAGGRTLAVIGSGLDQASLYPPSNRKLAQEIVKQGVLFSEYPPGTPALPFHFPCRNRIMAGLSLGVLVIEAAEKSGALITAQFALEENREVFAVPGSIFSSQSVGSNRLIKQGAKLVTDIEDILEELNLEKRIETKRIEEIVPESAEEKIILSFLSDEPIQLDKLIERTNLSIEKINPILTLMEMKGKVKNIGQDYYILPPGKKVKLSAKDEIHR